MTLAGTLELHRDDVDELLAGRRPSGLDGPAGLESAMADLADAPCELELTRGERPGHGWVGPQQAALAVPGGEKGTRLHLVPREFVPDALARLNAVGPRTQHKHASPVRFDAGALGVAIATGGHELTAAIREHWRVDAIWDGPHEGAVVGRSVEVLDTEDALWLIDPVDGQVELTQVRPTGVFVALCALLPTPAELDETGAG
jgi:hypothetical protein